MAWVWLRALSCSNDPCFNFFPHTPYWPNDQKGPLLLPPQLPFTCLGLSLSPPSLSLRSCLFSVCSACSSTSCRPFDMVGAQRPGSSNNNINSGNDNNNINSGGGGDDDEYEMIRDIHALTPPPPPPPPSVRTQRTESWANGSHHSSSLSTVGSEALSEQLASMSREFNAMVLAGSTMQNGDRDAGGNNHHNNNSNNLGRIGEEVVEETNPLAIVPDGGRPLDPPISSPRRLMAPPVDHDLEEVSLQRVKKEEVGSKISAWQTAKIAKINNRFKREDVVINGWESEQVEKATAPFKKVERKLDEKRARAMEKMQNEVAKAHRKAEEKRASAEAKRGTKVARILEMVNLMTAVGRAPSKRSFF